jgi:hypothetical protein
MYEHSRDRCDSCSQSNCRDWCKHDRFPSAAHLVSWARLCPGNNESAANDSAENPEMEMHGYGATYARWHGRPSHSRKTYLSEEFHHLAARKGKKRAIVAVDTPF